MELSQLPLVLLLISNIYSGHTEVKVQLSVSPQKWLTEGDPVTLICEVKGSSTGWTFSWFTVTETVSSGSSNHYKLLSDSSRGAGGKYTVSSAAVNHTGVYVCGAKREKTAYITYSNRQPLWVTGVSPRVSLIISPSRTQHFTSVSLSLSCEDQSNSDGWTVRRYTDSWGLEDCSSSVFGSQTGSTCTISSTITSHTGVYWCQSESGEKYHPVNITVQTDITGVILESPVHPVTEGDTLTLRCLDKFADPSIVRADFYKDGSLIQNQTTEMIISTVSKSHEGFYYCKYLEGGESLKSRISVRVGVILESPVHPVTEGDSLTLRCLYKHPNPSNPRADFYKDGSLIQNQTTEMIISTVSKSHEGLYYCKHPETKKESTKRWISVRERPKPKVIIKPDQHVFSGETVTLRCDIDAEGVTSWRFNWYKEGSTSVFSEHQEHTFRSVTESDAGKYSCNGSDTEGSHRSHISDEVTLTVSGSDGLKPVIIGVIAGLTAVFLIIVFLVLLWHFRNNKGGRSESPSAVSQQQNISQTSEQNQSEAGYNTPLSDGVSAPTEITYAEVELKSTNKQKKENKDKNTESCDVLYSKLKLETDQGAGSSDATYAQVK